MGELQRNIRETGAANAYQLLGYVYNETGRFQEASDAFRKALASPLADTATCLNGLAYSLQHLGTLEESTRHYQRSLAIRDDASVLYQIGMNHLRSGNKKEALGYFEKAVDQNPTLASLYPIVSALYGEFGMEQKLKAISAKFNDAVRLQEGKGHFKKGMEAYVQKNYKNAISEFTKAIEIDPSNPVLYSNLGYVYYDLDEVGKAFEYQKKALDIDPRFANAHYGLALIYKKWSNQAAAEATGRNT